MARQLTTVLMLKSSVKCVQYMNAGWSSTRKREIQPPTEDAIAGIKQSSLTPRATVPEDTPTRTIDQRRAHPKKKLCLKHLRLKLAALTNFSSLRGVARRSPRPPANENVKLEVEGGMLRKRQPGYGLEARGVLLPIDRLDSLEKT
ncbi:hypothetical protein AZE42_08814 [Rhizopogon vesiculosus]|uniref:Uncharacterized protein n=1 Tax=Rhizopogon vesiculosus TaxID=180088 RepID=A0A1J8Q268_9AGAM|nr:hypothetical protein AZE42_08814 [Rhizopogon vesiculosus]